MKLTITIQMDNAAFDPSQGFEVARILSDFVEAVRDCDDMRLMNDSLLRDVNGNAVGKAVVK